MRRWNEITGRPWWFLFFQSSTLAFKFAHRWYKLRAPHNSKPEPSRDRSFQSISVSLCIFKESTLQAERKKSIWNFWLQARNSHLWIRICESCEDHFFPVLLTFLAKESFLQRMSKNFTIIGMNVPLWFALLSCAFVTHLATYLTPEKAICQTFAMLEVGDNSNELSFFLGGPFPWRKKPDKMTGVFQVKHLMNSPLTRTSRCSRWFRYRSRQSAPVRPISLPMTDQSLLFPKRLNAL